MKHGRIVLALATLLAAVTLGASRPAQANARTKYVESITGKGKDVNNSIADMIGQAKKGDRIQIAIFVARIYGNQPPKIWTAINDALARGVEVEIVTEAANMSDATNDRNDPARSRSNARKTRAFFVPLETAGAKITYCENGCIRSNRNQKDQDNGLHAINHHKFFLLDFAEESPPFESRKIVVQSSANIHAWGDQAYEQAIAFNGDFYGNVWNQYSQRFAQMQQNWLKGNDQIEASIPWTKPEWRQVMAYIGPYSPEQQYNADGRSIKYDHYYQALQRIEPGRGCRVSIVMGHWSNSYRGLRLAEQLNRLADGGCSVDAVVGNKGLLENWGNGFNFEGKHHKVRFELEYQPKVHAKFVAMRFFEPARLAENKNPWRKLVFSGSHNFTKGSWSSDDDAFVRVDRPEVYDDFCDYFDEIESDSQGIHYGKQTPNSCKSYG